MLIGLPDELRQLEYSQRLFHRARNVLAVELSKEGRLLDLPQLRRRLEEAGIDLSAPVVTSCGSGVTAAVVTLALESLGHRDNKLYDGSLTEWGGRTDTPVETGPAQPKKA